MSKTSPMQAPTSAASPKRSVTKSVKLLNRKIKKAVEQDDVGVDAAAKLLAGISVVGIDELEGISGNLIWRSYRQRLDAMWKKWILKRQAKIEAWSKRELAHAQKVGGVLFYPFSGPDILHAEMFFPTASTIILVGLEPCGRLAKLKRLLKKDISRYLSRVAATLREITRFSFFRTKSMARQMFNKEAKRIDGTLPTMLLFLARMGHTIVSVERVIINAKGEIVPQTETRAPENRGHKAPSAVSAITIEKPNVLKVTQKNMGASRKRRRKAKGATRKRYTPETYLVQGNKLVFERKNGTKGTLYYFSINLADAPFKNRIGLQKMPHVISFFKNLPISTTYLKSASYLMHKRYFSTIRSIILAKSRFLLQDDSGIPYRYFNNEKWENHLYGSYLRPIELFKKRHQKDLRALYRAKKGIRPLPFGIGYQIARARSNLQFSLRKIEKLTRVSIRK